MYRLCSKTDPQQSDTFRKWITAKNKQKRSEKSKEYATIIQENEQNILRKEKNSEHFQKWLHEKLIIEQIEHKQRQDIEKAKKIEQKRRKTTARHHYRKWKQVHNKQRRDITETKKKEVIKQSLNTVLKNVSGQISFKKWIETFSENHSNMTERQRDRRPPWSYDIEDALDPIYVRKVRRKVRRKSWLR